MCCDQMTTTRHEIFLNYLGMYMVQYIIYTLLPLVPGLIRQTFFVNENLDSRGQNANYYVVRVRDKICDSAL
jgi:hypothetical protein